MPIGQGSAFEKQADGSLLELTLLGRFRGYDDATGDPEYGPLALSSLPAANLLPLVPLGAGLSASMPSRTSATLSWTHPDESGRLPVTGWRVYRDGVQEGSDLAASATGVTVTGLPTDTPELVFTWTVKAVCAYGVGYVSNYVKTKWMAATVAQPVPPTGLTAGTPTASQVQLNWAMVADSTVDKLAIYSGDTLLRDGLDKGATSYLLTGLTESTTYPDLNVRRHNVNGWSPGSNFVTVTTPAAGGSGVVHDPVVGTNTEGPEAFYFTDWPATRVYRINDAVSAFNLTQPRIIAVTDDPNVPRGGGASAAQSVENLLVNFYEGSGSAARANCEIHWANGNEVDREYTSGALPTAVIDTWRLMYDVIHQESSPGVRRFPKASMWVDMTTWQIKTAGAGPRFKAIAPYLDGVAASLYPAGRQQDPIVWSPYDDYILPVVAMAQDWHTTYPDRCYMFACWETGCPIDHALDTGGPNNLGTTNWTIRPRYFCGGRASNGVNYEGFCNNVYRRCDEAGLQLRELLYWNQQSDPSIPNPFKHDRFGVAQSVTQPDLVTAWRNWTPGSRLPDL